MELLAPRYGRASLADLLPSALAALGVPGDDPLGLADALPGVRRIAVLLIDGLGARALPMATDAPALAAGRAGRFGRLTELTCGFPSTTPTSLVSVGTGAPPGAHGVVGFTVRVPGTTDVLTHVLWDADVDPRAWQPLDTQFDRARAAGIRPSVVAPAPFARSGLTVAAYRGAAYRAASGAGATAAAVLEELRGAGRSLVYGYHAEVDRIGHLSGPGSPDWQRAVRDADDLVAAVAARLPADAALLVTADHGMLRVEEADKIDIDAVPDLPAGVAVIAGEPRARYVHALPGAAADVLATWRAVLGDRALVVGRDEAVEAGWYGPVTPAAVARIGDVVALATGPAAMVRTLAEPGAAGLRGYHGSLTEAEMAVPLLVVPGG